MRLNPNKLIFKTIILFLLICGFSTLSYAHYRENNVQLRVGTGLNMSLIRALKLNVAPEIRLGDNFGIDRYQLETGLKYKTFGFVTWNGSYRLEINPAKCGSSQIDHRYAFSTTISEKYGRFAPSLRLQYTNYLDSDIISNGFLRYSGLVKYDISNSRLSPYLYVEPFHSLSDNVISKVRYGVGADYGLNRKFSLGALYRLDCECFNNTNLHIISVALNISL